MMIILVLFHVYFCKSQEILLRNKLIILFLELRWNKIILNVFCGIFDYPTKAIWKTLCNQTARTDNST